MRTNDLPIPIFEIDYYVTSSGKSPVIEWMKKMTVITKAKIVAKIDRLSCGNFGNCKSLGHALYELKIDFGPGYRIYYSQAGKKLLLLLLGGDKSSQNKDIRKAFDYLHDHKENHEK